ncbi:TPR repeat protein [Duganella sp. 3397]|uniref:tetratricopeptide repeat protein n=1 Tax=Duganella sp. 3397 TaxID=2817732 RepID=UPI00285720BA|nr:SEL1-like repeat protein [Duganella sp. 3397]MDR7051180.1 TPR repeat protein [Duganella sp. 3397]
MSQSTRTPGSRFRSLGLGLGLVIALPAALLCLPAGAQQAPAPDLATRQEVVVAGKRKMQDPTEFIAADSRVLGRKFASSCAYMSGYNPYEDDLFIDYITSFHGLSSEVETIRDVSPLGDAAGKNTMGREFDSTMPGADATASSALSNQMEPSVKCSNTDRRFAAGRNSIARKDKTLNLALDAYDKGDYVEAMSQFKQNYSKLGNDFSALMLGRMYLEGKGEKVDISQALYWLDKAVNQRFGPKDRMRFDPKHPQLMNIRAEAAMTLAKVYMVGSGVKRDPRKALEFYEVAADSGYTPATGMLGSAYLSGFAGAKDVNKGVKYLKEAGEAGYAPALFQLGKAYYEGNDVPKDLKLAGAYFTAGAKEGHPGAQLAAARMYDFGESVAPDPKRALVYYKEAAIKGVPAAQNALGTYFYKGEVVDQNLQTARKLFNAAAMQAQPDAMYNLAIMTRNGEGGAKDLSMAYVWFSLAKQARYPEADVALAEVKPQLSQAELVRADALLKPGSGTQTK